MLVTVAMLVIIMTILVQVFQAATGALSAAQTIQQLDDQLKLLDATIRSDLEGVTAHFTPPLDPPRTWAISSTAKTSSPTSRGKTATTISASPPRPPPGRPFTGRMWVTAPASAPTRGRIFYNGNVQPVTVTSEYAEIIYFLRNGNLYRRVLLVAPELQSAIVPAIGNRRGQPGYRLVFLDATAPTPTSSPPATFGASAGELARGERPVGPAGGHRAEHHCSAPSAIKRPQASQTIVLNSLGDLTNRENRFAYSRFANDFLTRWRHRATCDRPGRHCRRHQRR